jgi:hypothetical protein
LQNFGGFTEEMARLCKYECGTMLEWDNQDRVFMEEGGQAHTKERCQELKAKGGTKADLPTFDLKVELHNINGKLDQIINFLRGQGSLDVQGNE